MGADLGFSPPLGFLFLAEAHDRACQPEDAIWVAKPARLLQNCTRINVKSDCLAVLWLAIATAWRCSHCAGPRQAGRSPPGTASTIPKSALNG